MDESTRTQLVAFAEAVAKTGDRLKAATEALERAQADMAGVQEQASEAIRAAKSFCTDHQVPLAHVTFGGTIVQLSASDVTVIHALVGTEPVPPKPVPPEVVARARLVPPPEEPLEEVTGAEPRERPSKFPRLRL